MTNNPPAEERSPAPDFRPPTSDQRPDVLAYLAEVRAAADALLGLDLDEGEPEAAFDPRWPESLPSRAREGAERGDSA